MTTATQPSATMPFETLESVYGIELATEQRGE